MGWLVVVARGLYLARHLFTLFIALGGKQLFSYQVWDGCGVIKVRYLIEVLKSQRGGCLNIIKIIKCILDIRLTRKKNIGMGC